MDVSCLWIFMIFMDFWCLWILTVYLWIFFAFFNGTVYEAFEMWFAWSRLPWTALAPAETWSLNDRGKVWKSTFELKSIGIQKTSGSHHLNTWKSSFLIHIYIYMIGGLEHLDYFSIYWECHHPNWRTHIFQRGRYTTNQNTFDWCWLCATTFWCLKLVLILQDSLLLCLIYPTSCLLAGHIWFTVWKAWPSNKLQPRHI